MAGWGLVMSVALLLACATAQNGPPYSATEEPPPRGAPQPRVGELPLPPDEKTTSLDQERRFPINEAELRKERAARAAPPTTGTGHVVVASSPLAHACDAFTQEERATCPLHDPRLVASIADLPDGVRVRLRLGAPPPERLKALFDCQQRQVTEQPRAPAACSFYDAHTTHEVVSAGQQEDVLFRRLGDVDALRAQVRAALAPAR